MSSLFLCFFPEIVVCISAPFLSQPSQSKILHFKRAVFDHASERIIEASLASLMYCILMERMHFFPPAGFNNLGDFQLLFQRANESSARMCTQGIDLGVDENLQERLSLKVLEPWLKMDIIRLVQQFYL